MNINEYQCYTAKAFVARLVALFIATALAGALMSGTSAQASNWSGATSEIGCKLNKADSAAHGYYYLSLNAVNTAAMDWSRTFAIDPTDVNTYNDTFSATTDVVVLDGNYKKLCGQPWYSSTNRGGAIGLATCSSLSRATCEQHRIYLSEPWTTTVPAHYVQALATHESGHTLGLAHRFSGSTAMQIGYPKPSRYYDGHDVTHLNTAY